MRICELTIENFRKFRQPVTLSGFSKGLNLVSEPNEAGKSTVLEALRAVLFERHGSKSDRIRSFRPYGDEVAPTIGLTFEIGAERWSLRKRFLLGPTVTLEGPGGRFQSDAAEEQLQSLLGFVRAGNRGSDDESRGALGLLWVEQGAWSLGAPGQAARKTLEEVLAGEVGAVTGGRRTTAVVQAIDKAMSELLTATGKPTRRLQEAQEALDLAKSANVSAKAELEQFEAVLNGLEAKRNALRRLTRDLTDPESGRQLEQLDQDLGRARAASQELQTADLRAQQATGRRELLEGQHGARERLRVALSAAEAQIAKAGIAVAAHGETLAAARLAEQSAADALEQIRNTLRGAEATRDATLAARSANERQALLRAAFARLNQALPLASRVTELRSQVSANLVTAEALKRVEDLERGVEKAHAAAQAGAASLRVDIEPGDHDVRLNGEPITNRLTASVTSLLKLTLGGVATVTVEPPASGEAALAQLRADERDRDDGLARLGVTSLADARQRARERREWEREIATAVAQIEAICSADVGLKVAKGLEALRAALAVEARPDDASTSETPPVGANLSEAAFQALRADARRAEAARQAALEALQIHSLKDVALEAELARDLAEDTRLRDQLASESAELADEALEAALDTLHQAEARALVDLASARRAATGLDEAALAKKKETLARHTSKLQEDRIELLQEIARLEVEAKTRGGAGPASRAQATAEELEFAQSAFDRLRDDADVLQLLKTMLGEAQQHASRRFLAPIKARVQPYVQRLLPAADLAFGEDYRPRLLVRGGREESADDLSMGTQEQLAVLTRLAFADLLIEKGNPASLVLDDALVFADDDRFEIMTDILSEAAQRMQIIILSCRTSVYRRIEAKKIVMS
jgi:energy-coupling factor transporter ATP-binding protein EcfA2